MVKHVVCFKLKDNSDFEKQSAYDMLYSMVGKVSNVESIEVGKDFLSSPRSFDIILISTHKDKVALSAYQKDAYHVNVVKEYMHAHIATSVAVDFEY